MAIQHDFKDLAVLITGAGRGLGRSVAAKLASCGATVGLVDIDAASCDAAAARIRDTGGRAFAYATDVSDRSAFSEDRGAGLPRNAVASTRWSTTRCCCVTSRSRT